MERSTFNLAFKQFKVTDVSEKKKYLMVFETYQTFVKKCKEKFGISDESHIYFVSEDDQDLELDSDVLEMVLEDKSLLIMKVDASVNNQQESQDGVEYSQSKEEHQGTDNVDDTHMKDDHLESDCVGGAHRKDDHLES
ncbi:uncharacterized protein LOC128553109, partial [Mercenaria mercenaria]|uniref:uncharacterized protein LOC128553109 n=1 Tax=Mercenaria mercenaria TaxID=6596 RepID=UPI00234F21E9